jgi:nicotinamide phosphoribosyltransferase
MSPINHKDAYKIGHINQYPTGTTEVYSNFTARSGKLSNVPGSTGIYFVGLQHFLKSYLIDDWNNNFFLKPKEEVLRKYKRRVSNILGYDVNVDHIGSLHDLGFLPVRIKSLPEGTFVPYGVPMLTIKNTIPEFYWVTNMLESVLSSELWQPITSATTYMAYRKICEKYADMTGVDRGFVGYQTHDFSFRGMPGKEPAAKSGAAVLAMGCLGTDCVSAIDLLEDYYEADSDKEVIGQSVNATEHSVMCSGGKEEELDTYKRLLTEVYPSGIVAIVSDTWDFWNVVTNTLPALKDIILGRDGKLVIRPDSGNPVDIVCGSVDAGSVAEAKGLIECLWDTFGGTINDKGYKVLDSHIGAIYGEAITLQRAEEILSKLEAKGFASSNIVFGVGSYTYQMVTRDTHGMAMKSTNVVINGKSTPIFKDPKTDGGLKKSAKGLLYVTSEKGVLKLVDEASRQEEKYGLLQTTFCNSLLFNETTLKRIRGVVNDQ